jgi:hypothetical protein
MKIGVVPGPSTFNSFKNEPARAGEDSVSIAFFIKVLQLPLFVARCLRSPCASLQKIIVASIGCRLYLNVLVTTDLQHT